MNKQDYIQIPIRDYNRLPIFETNVMDTLDDISVMRAMIGGLRKYADYLEEITKERETEIWDKMKCEDDARHFEDYMNKPQDSQISDLKFITCPKCGSDSVTLQYNYHGIDLPQYKYLCLVCGKEFNK